MSSRWKSFFGLGNFFKRKPNFDWDFTCRSKTSITTWTIGQNLLYRRTWVLKIRPNNTKKLFPSMPFGATFITKHLTCEHRSTRDPLPQGPRAMHAGHGPVLACEMFGLISYYVPLREVEGQLFFVCWVHGTCLTHHFMGEFIIWYFVVDGYSLRTYLRRSS